MLDSNVSQSAQGHLKAKRDGETASVNVNPSGESETRQTSDWHSNRPTGGREMWKVGSWFLSVPGCFDYLLVRSDEARAAMCLVVIIMTEGCPLFLAKLLDVLITRWSLENQEA